MSEITIDNKSSTNKEVHSNKKNVKTEETSQINTLILHYKEIEKNNKI